MTDQTPLQARPLALADNQTLPAFQPAGSYDRPEILVSPGLQTFVAGRIARHYLPALRALEPARFGLIAGPPGEGKTTAVKVACSRAGVDLVAVAGADFSGSTEDGARDAFETWLANIERIRTVRGKPVAGLIDDADLSVFTNRDNVEYAVSRDVLLGKLQGFADTILEGEPLPVFVTVNETNVFRTSLFRHGRAAFYVHRLPVEEKIKQVAALFKVKPGDRQLVADFVTQNAEQPLAFFAALPEAALDAVVAEVAATLGIEGTVANWAVRRRMRDLTVADYIAAAEGRAKSVPASFL